MLNIQSIDSNTVIHISCATGGGYTVYTTPRQDGRHKVTLCQCNSNKKYVEYKGTNLAKRRQQEGKFFVLDNDALLNLIQTLEKKLDA